jgi:hypothetical protein
MLGPLLLALFAAWLYHKIDRENLHPVLRWLLILDELLK